MTTMQIVKFQAIQVISIVLVTNCLGGADVNSAEMPGLDSLFEKAILTRGQEYVRNRAAILSSVSGVGDFLSAKMKSGESAEERWLAEILHARLMQREAFIALEQEFQQKVFLYFRNHPSPTIVQSYYPGYREGLLIPGEPLRGDANMFPYRGLIEAITEPGLRAYWESLRIEESPLWSSVCGEILMKGWVPEGEVQNPHGQLKKKKPLSDTECLSQAMIVLGKLGERRAGPFALRFLEDPKQDSGFRRGAAVCLGRLKFIEGLPAMLKLCEATSDDDNTTESAKPEDLHLGLFDDICFSMVEIGDYNVVPEMERISKVLQEKHDEALRKAESSSKKRRTPLALRSISMTIAAQELKKKMPIQ